MVHLEALKRYKDTKVHFVDCLMAASADAQNTAVASFDRDFRKFSDVRVEN
jgi:predicted nucleic acid-binding protein